MATVVKIECGKRTNSVVVVVAVAAPFQSRLGFRGCSCLSVVHFLLSLPLMATKVAAIWNHPAGPKTIHFWAPTFKWGISIANIADFQKPPEKISYPQQLAVTATGLIWSRYSMVITPKNWNLFSVNVAMATTGLYQLSRKIKQDYMAVPVVPEATKKVADA